MKTAKIFLILCITVICCASNDIADKLSNQNKISTLSTSVNLNGNTITDSQYFSQIKRITQIGKKSNKCMEHLYHLTNAIGKRPSGSNELHDACEWAMDKFIEFGLTNVHLDYCGIAYPNKLAEVLGISGDTLYNVVADIQGSDLKDQYVIIGAHIDSHNVGDGAQDDGTGVAATLEAARILNETGVIPRRTIRFILFSGEEIGKIGSKAYVKKHPDVVNNTSAMFNMDHGSDYISGIYATKYMLDDFNLIFDPVKSLDSTKHFKIIETDDLNIYYITCCGSGGTSDHGPFLDAGIPAFFWLQDGNGSVPYYAHTKDDTYDKVSAEYLNYSTTIIALTAAGVSNLDNMISRTNILDKNKVKKSSCAKSCGR